MIPEGTAEELEESDGALAPSLGGDHTGELAVVDRADRLPGLVDLGGGPPQRPEQVPRLPYALDVAPTALTLNIQVGIACSASAWLRMNERPTKSQLLVWIALPTTTAA